MPIISLRSFSMKKKVILFFGFLSCVITGVLIFSIFSYKKSKKTLDIAYINLSKEVSLVIQNQVSSLYDGKIQNYEFSYEEKDLEKKLKKTDYIFTLDGDFVKNTEKKRFDSEVFNKLPKSIRRTDKNILPILLDNYEIAYSKDLLKELNCNVPTNLFELDDLLKKSKSHVFSPFFCAGKDDKTLFGLISCFVESFGGKKSYEKFVEVISSSKSFEKLLDVQLNEGEKDGEFTLRNILDLFKSWQQNEIVHPNWFNATKTDLNYFLQEEQVGVIFLPLSEHRTISRNLISKFEVSRFPVINQKIDHCLIAPSVVVIKKTKNELFDSVISEIVNDKIQTQLSKNSKWGPVSLKSQAYDRQADDVRFWASSCKGGQTPDLYNAVFQLDKERGNELANQIRSYLSQKN